MSSASQPTIDFICDLRQLSAVVDDVGTLQNLWGELEPQLSGEHPVPGQTLQLRCPEGVVVLWVVEAQDTEQTTDRKYRIVDVLRNPKLLYQCVSCGRYGPLRCAECERSGREKRLCSEHAHTIEDELSAYCPEHVPHCNCRPNCSEKALFLCRRCNNAFGSHFRQNHPNDAVMAYCRSCYRLLFERCATPSCRYLGKSKCTYQTRQMSQPCLRPLCSEHSYQWKLWGAHNRGVTLCDSHRNLIGNSDPADLIFMMLIAKAPVARDGRRRSLPNPFRLRRIINRNRSIRLSFDLIGRAIRSLEDQVPAWGRLAESNYRHLDRAFQETTRSLAQAESNLLLQARSFYHKNIGWEAAQQITSLEITDRYFKPGQPPRYRVSLYLRFSNKGLFIGRGGNLINQLRTQLNLEIDLQSEA